MWQEGPQARAGEAAPRKAPTGQEWREAKGLRRTGDRGSRGGNWGATPRSAAIAPWNKFGAWRRRRDAGCRRVRKVPLRAGVAGSGPCRAPFGRRGLRPLRWDPTARAANHTRGGVRRTPPRSHRSAVALRLLPGPGPRAVLRARVALHLGALREGVAAKRAGDWGSVDSVDSVDSVVGPVPGEALPESRPCRPKRQSRQTRPRRALHRHHTRAAGGWRAWPCEISPAHLRRLRGRRKPPPARVICGEGGRLRQEGPQARAGEAAPRKAPTGQEWCEAKGLRRTGDRGSRGGTWGATPRSAAIAPWKKFGPWRAAEGRGGQGCAQGTASRRCCRVGALPRALRAARLAAPPIETDRPRRKSRAWRGAAHPATQPAEVRRGNHGGNAPAASRRGAPSSGRGPWWRGGS